MADFDANRIRRGIYRRLTGRERDPVYDLIAEGFFDLEYYRAQVPDADLPSHRDAARHYRDVGRSRGLGFHPLIEPEWWAGVMEGAPDRARDAERAFVHGWLCEATSSPVLSEADGPVTVTRDYLRDVLAGRRSPALPAGLTAAEAADRMRERVRLAARSAPNAGRRSGVDWSSVSASASERVRGRVSVLVPTYQDWLMTTEAVRAALRHAGDADIEVVVVDNGSRPAVHRILLGLFLGEPRVRIIRADENTNFSGGMNIAIAASTGEFILLLNNDAVLADSWLPPLLRDMRSSPLVRGVQPLLLYPHIERIQAAGTTFLGEGVVPWHFLAGHPVEDALRMPDRRFRAVTAAVMMVRALDIIEANGFDEEYANGYEDVDLCLRMTESPGHHFLVTTDSRAYHPEGSSPGRSLHDSANRVRFLRAWRGRMPAPEVWRYRDLGFDVVAMRPHTFVDDVPVVLSDPQLVRPVREVPDGPGSGLACLRWVLHLGAGDLSPARALTEALESLGQEVVSIRGGIRYTDGLDDVLVAFDDAAPFTPRAPIFNVLVLSDESPAPVRDTWNAVIAPSGASVEGAPPHHRVEGDPSSWEAVLRALISDAEANLTDRYDRTRRGR